MGHEPTPAHPFLRVGHKGAARLAPPNTVRGIEAAAAHGVDAVELDVVAGPNGALALGHDAREAARRATALDTALDRIAASDLRVLVDLKAPGIEKRVVAALHAHGLADRALVCARDPRALRTMRAHDARLPRGWSLRWPWHARLLPGAGDRGGGVPAATAAALADGTAGAIMLHHSLIGPAAVAAVHAAGAPLYAWTVNTRARLRRLAALGVDAVITDDPRIFDAL